MTRAQNLAAIKQDIQSGNLLFEIKKYTKLTKHFCACPGGYSFQPDIWDSCMVDFCVCYGFEDRLLVAFAWNLESIRERTFLTNFAEWAGGVAPWRQELFEHLQRSDDKS